MDSKDKRNLTPEQCNDWWEKAIAKGYFDKWSKGHLTVPRLYAKIPLNKNSEILEIGCGHGRQLTYFMDHYKNVYGIDVSKTVIEIARKNCSNAIIRTYDGVNIPYSDNTFDFVTSVFVLQHMKKEQAKILLEESLRVLKEGGYFLHEFAGGIHIAGKGKENFQSIGQEGIYNNSYTFEEIKKLFKELNLNVQWIEEINMSKWTPNATNIWVCVKK